DLLAGNVEGFLRRAAGIGAALVHAPPRLVGLLGLGLLAGEAVDDAGAGLLRGLERGGLLALVFGELRELLLPGLAFAGERGFGALSGGGGGVELARHDDHALVLPVGVEHGDGAAE